MTRDAALRGQLHLLQPLRGYRYTVDPLLLVDFVVETAKSHRGPLQLVDLGAGCGVLGLALLRRLPTARLTAVELQPRLAELARRNAVGNGMEDRTTVVELDVADPKQAKRVAGGRFDWVVSNPPYGAIGRGATSPDEESAIARHELRLPLQRLCQEMKRMLRPEGMGAVIYPAARLSELLSALTSVGLAARRLKAIHPRAGEPATRVMLSFQKKKAQGAMVLEPPLMEHPR